MKKKLLSVILASALTVGLLSACGSDSAKDNDVNSKTHTTETGSNTTRSDTSSAPVSVTLNEVAHSIFYAPMYVAIENGYFEDEGIELTLITGFGADKTMTAVISGEADIGFMGSEASIYTYNEGANDSVVNFAQLTQRAGNFLVAREEMKDFKWTDLKGKDVLGGRKGGMPEMVFEYILKQNGIDPQTDLNINQGIDFGSTAAAFSEGSGDFTVELHILLYPQNQMIQYSPRSYLLRGILLLNPSLELVNESLLISGKSICTVSCQSIDLLAVEVWIVLNRNSVVNHLVLVSFRCNVVQFNCENL